MENIEIICEVCGEVSGMEFVDNRAYCEHCGTEYWNLCSYCGEPMDPDFFYCESCGEDGLNIDGEEIYLSGHRSKFDF